MFENILRSHLTRYPDMQIQDVYKLIHQAAMGSEHAIPDPESARKWMEREIADMGEWISEPVIDPISADGMMVRVHLRSYIAAGGETEALLEAFVRTAIEYRGDARLLEQYWNIALGLARQNELPFTAANMDDFFKPLRRENFPALHHSPEYKKKYHPAYRVVKRDFLIDAKGEQHG